MADAPSDPKLVPTQHYDAAADRYSQAHFDAIPEQIGPYRILERIGAGGMGEIFRAEQRSPIRREVALKFIKLGMDTKTVIARFEAERQALALMDHPHIAKVLDAGADETGRPYFVMEYVKGTPITEYADRNQLTISERLELVEQVCEAIQHAHQKGVIHRDVKPSNVLVRTHDGKAFVKVIDFGIAKAIGQRLTEKTLFTGHEQFVGTPQYMSPEQAEGSLDIDTRTDVYSLGVLLYELLTGTPPFSKKDLKQVAWEAFRKQIIEVDPPRPSTRLSDSGPALATIATLRRTEPRRLGTLVRGELDWIVMKALEKDRGRRYETAIGLSRDLRAHLTGKPIEAAPPSATYRVRKFFLRNKIAVIVGGVSLLLTVIAFTGITYGLLQARRAENDIRTALETKDRALQDVVRERNAKDTALLGEQSQRRAAEENLTLANQRLYHADMNLAQLCWDAANLEQMNDTLEAYRPQDGDRLLASDPRHFEWFYLNRLCHSDLLTIRGHNGHVRCVAYAPDGRRIASGGADGTVRFWSPATGMQLQSLNAHSSALKCVAFSPDGTRLATGGQDGSVKVWDPASGMLLQTLEGHAGDVNCLRFSPDGSLLASGSHDNTIILWEIPTGQKSKRLQNSPHFVMGVAFSPDGRRLAGGDFFGTITVWDVASGEAAATLKGHANSVSSVAFSPDGSQLASGSYDRSVKLWDVDRKVVLQSLAGHSSDIQCVVFDEDGKRLASCGWDNTINIWDAASGQLTDTFKGHSSWVNCVAFSPQKSELASVSNDGTIKIWDTTIGQQSLTIDPMHLGMNRSIAFSPDGQMLSTTSSRNDVKIYDVRTGQELHHLMRHSDSVRSVAFSPDGRKLVSAGWDGKLLTWDTVTGKLLSQTEDQSRKYEHVTFDPSGARLAAKAVDGKIDVFDSVTGKTLLALTGAKGSAGNVVFSRDGSRLFSIRDKSTVAAWDIVTGNEVLSFHTDSDRLNCVAVSPNDEIVAASGWDGGIFLWDFQSGQQRLVLKSNTTAVLSIDFSPDGRRLATADWDRSVKLWDTVSGQLTLTLHGHTHAVTSVAFSPDGMCLASGSHDRKVKIWDAQPWTPERRDEQRALAVVRDLIDRQGYSRTGAMEFASRDVDLTPAQRLKALEFIRGWWVTDDVEVEFTRWRQFAGKDPGDTIMRLKLAALCAWNKRTDYLAEVRAEAIQSGESSTDALHAERCAKICCFVQNPDPSQLARARECAERAIREQPDSPYVLYFHLAFGMANYRLDDYAAALSEFELVTGKQVTPTTISVTSAFFQAMCLAKLGRSEEAMALHAQGMKNLRPMPRLGKNPLANGANADDLIAWLASQECLEVIDAGN